MTRFRAFLVGTFKQSILVFILVFGSLNVAAQVLEGLSSTEVRKFESVYSGKLKRHTLLGIKRSGRFMPAIKSIFSEYGIPPELGWLVLVESNFNETARSPKAACGLFQFIGPTARAYNLHVDDKWPEWFIDERLEFYFACHASASFLSELYAQFHSWTAAVSAYNTGPGNVRKAMRRAKSKEWKDYHRFLARETQEYANRIAAVMNICRDPMAFGLQPERLPYIPFTLYIVREPSSVQQLAKRFGSGDANAFIQNFVILNRQFNEKYLIGGTAIPIGFVAKLPDTSGLDTGVVQQGSPAGNTESGSAYLHFVEVGEDLATLGFIYRISVEEIVAQNPHIKGYELSPGMKINLHFPRKEYQRGTDITVTAGQTLGEVVLQHRVNGSALVSLNGLRTSRFKEDQTLYVPE